ncbi:hypothetical protein Tco_1252345 [Tanacetum coccineum]|uniref:Retrotransposon gag domain-containing protein n=1 Tax=Tanacetum coccineum TaxID=301880 RepID=A0ABQ5ASH7_9ASTR
MPPKRNGMSTTAIEQLISQRVNKALMAHETNRNSRNLPNGDSNSVGRGERTMESVSQVSNYDDNCQMKYATCTLLDGALTWWNTHMKTVGIDAAYQTSWTELKKMMTTEYCLKNEELALLCLGMVPEEEKKIERYIWGLIEKIKGNVTSLQPTKISDAIRMSHKLMNQIVRANSARSSDNKRKWENN